MASSPRINASLVLAEVLGRASLDWYVSLARTLSMWVPEADNAAPDAQGRLILAWANLGALVEGTPRWFAAAYAEDYFAVPEVPRGRDVGNATAVGFATAPKPALHRR